MDQGTDGRTLQRPDAQLHVHATEDAEGLLETLNKTGMKDDGWMDGWMEKNLDGLTQAKAMMHATLAWTQSEQWKHCIGSPPALTGRHTADELTDREADTNKHACKHARTHP